MSPASQETLLTYLFLAIWFLACGYGAIYLFFRGFREIKYKRTIQDIPTSKINTGAVGTNVEIHGFATAQKDQLVTAPLSGKTCVLYKMEIQEWVENRNDRGKMRIGGSDGGAFLKIGGDGDWSVGAGGRHGYWRTIDHYFSGKGFYLNDDSGATAWVSIEGAEIHREGDVKEYEVSSAYLKNLPPLLSSDLKANNKKLRKFNFKKIPLMDSDYRFLEWRVELDEYFYALGYAESGMKRQKVKKPSYKWYKQAKKMIEENKKLQGRFDTNQDGDLDYYELEKGAKIVAQKLEAKYQQEQPKEDSLPPTKMLLKKKKSHPLIISNSEEKDLTKNIAKWSFFKIVGAPVLFLIGSFPLYVFLSK